MLRALDLAEALDAGDLSATTVVELVAEAVDSQEGDVRAFANIDLDAARAAAARPAKGTLRGLPVAFKDIIDTADMPTEYGSPVWKGWRPRADAAIVSMTRAAGGLVLGKTQTTELAFMQPAPTRNPRDLSRSPGGSSAGSAAAVAAGMAPLAFGTQTGGSVIRPASYCGVAALKPSFRLLPTVGVKIQSWTMDTLGLFGARIEDVAFGLEAITGRGLRVDGRDFGAPTIGVMDVDFAGKAEPESEAALRFALRVAAKAGARIVTLEAPAAFARAFEAHNVINQYEAALSFAWELENHSVSLSDVLRTFLRPEKPADVDAYDAARGEAKAARRAAKAFFDNIDVLLTFAAPGVAPDPSSTGTSIFNRLFTLLGTPAANVPGYLTSDGLPVGVQVIAPFGDDLAALAAARFVESALAKAL
jgi:Asp-tRNA(Asn)/Glu-tRNA(Gln) amidotransferase A subunit family amidase